MRKHKKIWIVVLGIAIVAAVAVGFWRISNASTKDTKTTESSNKTEVVAATSAVSNPFSYQGTDGLTGYDVELLNAIFKGSKKYKLTWETVEFASILSGLDSGRYTVGANNFSSNEERREKYLFSDPIVKNPNVMVVRSDSDISSLSDLAGKKAVTEVGNSGATILEDYNSQNPDDTINITYTKEDLSSQFLAIENGTYDVRIVSKISAEQLIKQNGYDDLKIVSLTTEETGNLDVNSYFLLANNEEGEKIQKFMNKRLKTLRENGTWEKISEEFFDENNLPDEE
ncbi:transporter substrate-binding domain-containing protein [Streptococcus infantarius]|uniref:transporter substrate-binding domain-containing protein n=1 Tax=Streptococcus infantarius TaxID=102684 RepID=UPI00208E94DE|nr:amino acid ABC transporter substrate-binding protein [Streptococcus infantarius subsp. infantarius]